ncbi:MAG: hypothetical protein ACRC10_00615 [Thermoguttaceae bacterium]
MRHDGYLGGVNGAMEGTIIPQNRTKDQPLRLPIRGTACPTFG